MQQTTKYKLNLIESSDPFLPDGLNANTQKIEAALDAAQADTQAVRSEAAAALSAEAAARAAADASLNARLQVFEAKRFVYGTCTTGTVPYTVHLGFTPVAVVIHYLRSIDDATALAVAGQPSNSGIDIIEGGFTFDVGSNFNVRAGNYAYIAFG